jgi:hypothetical protein
VAGGWQRLHSEELHNLNVSPNTIRVIKSNQEDEMSRACSTHGKDKKCIQHVGWKS